MRILLCSKNTVFLIFGLLISQTVIAQTDPYQDLSLDELLAIKVTSPSRKLESVRETSSSVMVITRRQLLDSGARNMRDAMRLVPGIQSINNSDERLIASRGIFADNGGKILIMIDGHEVNRYQDQGSSGEIPNMFIDKIERLEIIRGPGGVIYGPAAFSGIVNIITREAEGNKSSRARLSIGSYDQLKAEVSVDDAITDALFFTLYAGVADSHGDSVALNGDEFTPSTPSVNNIEELDTPAFEVLSKLSLGKLNLKLRYHDIDTRFPSKNDFLIKYRTGFAELTYDTVQLSEHLELRPRAYVDGVEIKRNGYEAGEVRAGTEMRLSYIDPLGPYSWVSGFEFRKDFFGNLPFSGGDAVDSFQGNQTSVPSLLDDSVDFTSVGIYTQHDYYLTDAFKVTGGVRFDSRSETESYWSPRLGLVLLPSEESSVKLLFQSAHLPPSSESLGPSAIKDRRPNRQVESIDSIELIYNQSLGFGALETSAYYNRVRNLEVIEFNDLSVQPPFGLSDVPLFVFDNATELDIYGVEVLYRFDCEFFHGTVSHSTIIDSDVNDGGLNVILVTTNGDDINGYSDNVSKLDLNFKLHQKVNLNLNALVDWGKNGVLRRNGVRPEAEDIDIWNRRVGDWDTVHVDPLFFLNSTLRVNDPFGFQSTLLLTGYNLLDELGPDYNNSGYTEQTQIGRSVFLSVLLSL